MSVNVPVPQRLSATLIARRQLAPEVVSLRFRTHEGQRLTWLPGQYLTLATRDLPDVAVPYSIASAEDPARAGEFELAISSNGGQELLARLHLGVEVYVTPPQGRFVWRPTPGATLLVGIGTGLSPLRAILQAVLSHDDHHPVALLFGARSEADILWRDEFAELAARAPRFSFEPTLTQPGAAWRGRVGRVQDHLPGVAGNLRDVSAYICGSRAMVADCAARLTDELGVDAARVLAEAH